MKSNSSEKTKILLVDDDPDMCESLSDVITLKTHHKVDFTTNPKKALNILKTSKYHIAVLDYKMPDMNGIELLKKIKKTRPDTAVFLLTAFITEDLIASALEEGAVKVMSKFSWPEDIIKTIMTAL